MPKYSTKEIERKQLLEQLFSDPHPGQSLKENPLFFICRDLGSSYCLGYEENGYTKESKGFDGEKVRREVSRLLTDDHRLVTYVEKYANNVYNSFFGQFYTFDKKTRKFELDSKWPEFEKKLDAFLARYGSDAKAVLDAIYEVNFVNELKWKNYYPIMALAKNKGLDKGWRTMLSELQLMELIDTDTRHINLPIEMRPLIEKVLGR
jgi:hypothetical protein